MRQDNNSYPIAIKRNGTDVPLVLSNLGHLMVPYAWELHDEEHMMDRLDHSGMGVPECNPGASRTVA